MVFSFARICGHASSDLKRQASVEPGLMPYGQPIENFPIGLKHPLSSRSVPQWSLEESSDAEAAKRQEGEFDAVA